MWCWRRMEEMSWNNPLRNEEVLQRVKEERNISQTIKRRNANRTCYILHRNCFLKHILERNIEGRMEVVGRWGRRHKQLLYNTKDKKEYHKMKEEALDRTLWRTCFGTGYRTVIRQTTEWMNEWMNQSINHSSEGYAIPSLACWNYIPLL